MVAVSDPDRCDGCGRREPVTETGRVALCDGCAHATADDLGLIEIAIGRLVDAVESADVLDPFQRLDRRERLAWAGALVLFVGGDVATTLVGLVAGASESNPVALAAFSTVGVLPGMAALKGGVLGVAGVGWSRSPRWARAIAPGLLAVIGAIATVSNAAVIASNVPDVAVAFGALAIAWTALVGVGVAR